jgi:signal recognition particle GTPase
LRSDVGGAFDDLYRFYSCALAGKLTYRLQNEGLKVLLAAGDTFRAAAVEQLEKWAERTGAEFVKGAGVKSRPSAGRVPGL